MVIRLRNIQIEIYTIAGNLRKPVRSSYKFLLRAALERGTRVFHPRSRSLSISREIADSICGDFLAMLRGTRMSVQVTTLLPLVGVRRFPGEEDTREEIERKRARVTGASSRI
jgi:hypothetical protein